MADSLCGPSNALQNFQKHSTVDRTLQQDRLISTPSPSQGFRSSPGPNGGHIEPEFQAFQAGNLPLESQHGFQPPHFSHAPQNLQQPGPAAWASDFQRMHISSPPPQFQEQFKTQMNAPTQRHDTGGWHQDFARQFGAEQRVMAQTSQMGGSSAYGFSPMNGGMGMGMGMQSQFAGFSGGMAGQQAEQSNLQQQHQPAEAFDEEAFARAFEEASKSEMEAREEFQERSKSGIEFGQDVMIEESAERFLSATIESPIPNQARLGADLIHDPLSETQDRPQHEDPDALARTAGQLLDSVRNNQSAKFQNSEFLELMRQLRDREVMVKGDNIVGTNDRGEGEEAKVDAP